MYVLSRITYNVVSMVTTTQKFYTNYIFTQLSLSGLAAVNVVAIMFITIDMCMYTCVYIYIYV